MKIDLHIHCKECSDGRLGLEDIFKEAHRRQVGVISITDHDSIDCQERALSLAEAYGIHYVTGVELNISFSFAPYREGKAVSLDLLGYAYDMDDVPLREKLRELREYRRIRAEKIFRNVNRELVSHDLAPLTEGDFEALRMSVDGTLGRPHIADYLVRKGIVNSRQEGFDQYLVKCDVPKMPLSLAEAAGLIHAAGGKAVLAHPSNPQGTSLVSLTHSVAEQHRIIREGMLPHLDGIECWHPGHEPRTTASHLNFAREEQLMATGGSDCHQQPVILGTVPVPDFVAAQFGIPAESR